MWYKRSEAQKRFTFFFASTSLAGAFGGLLASAIGKSELTESMMYRPCVSWLLTGLSPLPQWTGSEATTAGEYHSCPVTVPRPLCLGKS